MRFGSRSEPAVFIKFVVVGQVAFRYCAEDLSPAEYDGGIVKPVVERYRQSCYAKQWQWGRFFQQLGQGGFGLLQQEGLCEQVATGVACDRKFGEGDDGRSL